MLLPICVKPKHPDGQYDTRPAMRYSSAIRRATHWLANRYDAMTRHRIYGTIAAMLAFLAVMLTTELACAPAAPVGQDGTGEAVATPEATPVPTNTNTPEPTPSPTPPVTPDLAKLGVNTEAVIAFLAVPTRSAALTGDAAINGVAVGDPNSLASGTVARADNSVAGGTTGDDTTPAMPPITLPALITVSISTLDLAATRSFLETNDGAITETSQWPGAPNWNIFAEMPPALLPALSQQPEIHHAFVHSIYEKVDDYIGNLIIEEAIAQSNNPTWLPGSGGITVIVKATPEGYANARSFLERYNVPITRSNFSSTGVQVIPPNLIVPVSELPGVNFIRRIPEAWPQVMPQSRHRGW